MPYCLSFLPSLFDFAHVKNELCSDAVDLILPGPEWEAASRREMDARTYESKEESLHQGSPATLPPKTLTDAADLSSPSCFHRNPCTVKSSRRTGHGNMSRDQSRMPACRGFPTRTRSVTAWSYTINEEYCTHPKHCRPEVHEFLLWRRDGGPDGGIHASTVHDRAQELPLFARQTVKHREVSPVD